MYCVDSQNEDKQLLVNQLYRIDTQNEVLVHNIIQCLMYKYK